MEKLRRLWLYVPIHVGIKFYKDLKEVEEMLKRARKPLRDFNVRMPFC